MPLKRTLTGPASDEPVTVMERMRTIAEVRHPAVLVPEARSLSISPEKSRCRRGKDPSRGKSTARDMREKNIVIADLNTSAQWK